MVRIIAEILAEISLRHAGHMIPFVIGIMDVDNERSAYTAKERPIIALAATIGLNSRISASMQLYQQSLLFTTVLYIGRFIKYIRGQNSPY